MSNQGQILTNSINHAALQLLNQSMNTTIDPYNQSLATYTTPRTQLIFTALEPL